MTVDSLVCKTEHFASALSTMLTDKKNDLNSGGFRNLTDEAREAVGAEEEKKSTIAAAMERVKQNQQENIKN